MSAQLAQPPTKPRSDSTLKTKSDELQDEIVKESRTKSHKELSDWLGKERQIQTSPSAVGRFLGWFRTTRQGTGNEGTKEALQDMNKSPAEFFQDTMVDQHNLAAWHQSERVAVRREELEIRRQEVQLQREEVQLQRERVKLDQEKFQRSHSEYIVNTCNNPKIGAAARKKGVSYAHKVKEVDTIMFGSNESTN
jgi:hypothetical protein